LRLFVDVKGDIALQACLLFSNKVRRGDISRPRASATPLTLALIPVKVCS